MWFGGYEGAPLQVTSRGSQARGKSIDWNLICYESLLRTAELMGVLEACGMGREGCARQARVAAPVPVPHVPHEGKSTHTVHAH